MKIKLTKNGNDQEYTVLDSTKVKQIAGIIHQNQKYDRSEIREIPEKHYCVTILKITETERHFNFSNLNSDTSCILSEVEFNKILGIINPNSEQSQPLGEKNNDIYSSDTESPTTIRLIPEYFKTNPSEKKESQQTQEIITRVERIVSAFAEESDYSKKIKEFEAITKDNVKQNGQLLKELLKKKFPAFIEQINIESLPEPLNLEELFSHTKNESSTKSSLKEQRDTFTEKLSRISSVKKRILELRDFYYYPYSLSRFDRNDQIAEKCIKILTVLQTCETILKTQLCAIDTIEDQDKKNCIIVRTFFKKDKQKKILCIPSSGHITIEFHRSLNDSIYVGFYADKTPQQKKPEDTFFKRIFKKAIARFFKELRLPNPTSTFPVTFVTLNSDLDLIGPDKKFDEYHTTIIPCDRLGAELDFENGYLWAQRFVKNPLDDFNIYKNNCSTVVLNGLKAAGAEQYLSSSSPIDTPTNVMEYAKNLEKKLAAIAAIAAINDQENALLHDSIISPQNYYAQHIYFAIQRLKLIKGNPPILDDIINQLATAYQFILNRDQSQVNNYITALEKQLLKGINVIKNINKNKYREVLSILTHLCSFFPDYTTKKIKYAIDITIKTSITTAVNQALSLSKVNTSLIIHEFKKFQESKNENTNDKEKIGSESKNENSNPENKAISTQNKDDSDILLFAHGWKEGLSPTPEELGLSPENAKKLTWRHVLQGALIQLSKNIVTAEEQKDPHQLKKQRQYRWLLRRINLIMDIVNVTLDDNLESIYYPCGVYSDKAFRLKQAIMFIAELRQRDQDTDAVAGVLSLQLETFYKTTLENLRKALTELNVELYFQANSIRNPVLQNLQHILPHNVTNNDFELSVQTLIQNAKSENIWSKFDNRLLHLPKNKQKEIIMSFIKAANTQPDSTTIEKPSVFKFWHWGERHQHFELETKGELYRTLNDEQNPNPMRKIQKIEELINKNRPSRWKVWRRKERARYDEMRADTVIICLVDAFANGYISEATFCAKLTHELPSLPKEKFNKLKKFLNAFKTQYASNIDVLQRYQKEKTQPIDNDEDEQETKKAANNQNNSAKQPHKNSIEILCNMSRELHKHFRIPLPDKEIINQVYGSKCAQQLFYSKDDADAKKMKEKSKRNLTPVQLVNGEIINEKNKPRPLY